MLLSAWKCKSIVFSAMQMKKCIKTVLTDGRRKVWKSGRGERSSNIVGIICPPGWNRVNWPAKVGTRSPFLPPSSYDPVTFYSKALRCTFFEMQKNVCSSKFVQLELHTLPIAKILSAKNVRAWVSMIFK